MKFSEIEKIMHEEHLKDENKPHECWAFRIAVPRGIIETQEQYDYIRYYSENTCIRLDGMKSFEEDRGRYLNIGDYFGGASFYFTTYSIDYINKMIEQYPDIYDSELEWSYGKYGKVEF